MTTSRRIGHDDGTIDLWFVTSEEDVNDSELFEGLSPSEKNRYAEFSHKASQRAFAIGKLLTRRMLSFRNSEVAPPSWEFTANSFGRPEVAESYKTLKDVHFNLSHSKGLVACAVASTPFIGVDIERERTLAKLSSLATGCLSSREMETFLLTREALRQSLFFRTWTLKESYTKALGKGLSLPLPSFSIVEKENGEHSLLAKGPEFGTSLWSFYYRRLSSGHHLSLAVKKEDKDQVITVRKKTVSWQEILW